jgi:large subunit ribosomal protein L10
MPSRLNQLVVSELTNKFADTDTVLFVNFSGLNGRKAAALRSKMREECGDGADVTVVKTSLLKRAFQDIEALHVEEETLDRLLEGPTAVAHGADDPVQLAKMLADWMEKEKVLEFKGGILAGRPLPADGVIALSKIPPKPVLLGQVVGSCAAPLTSMLGVCQGLLRQIVGLADALREKMGGGSEADPGADAAE